METFEPLSKNKKKEMKNLFKFSKMTGTTLVRLGFSPYEDTNIAYKELEKQAVYKLFRENCEKKNIF